MISYLWDGVYSYLATKTTQVLPLKLKECFSIAPVRRRTTRRESSGQSRFSVLFLGFISQGPASPAPRSDQPTTTSLERAATQATSLKDTPDLTSNFFSPG
mmetsp:Transcript_21274/g.39439  ORF Transcript_21274/g.39439 Transcript_21274/m.39439 type:complete len:101 (+) Transcript_21274:1-303(+)